MPDIVIEYEMNGNKLQEVEEEKDLGIIVTTDLKPSVQCAKAAAKAMQVLGVINIYLTALCVHIMGMCPLVLFEKGR